MVVRKMASTYKTDFGKALEILYRTVQARRHWASEVWNDTEAGKGKDIKMLEYACGPGVISQVSVLHGSARFMWLISHRR